MPEYNNTKLISGYSVIGLIIGVFVAQLLQSCATLVEPVQALGHTWRAYERTIRWGNVAGASTFLTKEDAAKAKYPQNIKQLKVTGYDVVTKSINEKTMTAHQTVNIRYYFEDYPVEKSFVDMQEWRYDNNKTRWFLVTSVPQFTAR